MAYTYRIFDSIADASNEDWERCFRAMPTVFMDRKFLLTVEKTLGNESKFWHVIFYDTDLEPVAWTSLCTFRVDLTTLASSAVKRIFEVGRHVLPSLARMKILFCGLPVSVGQKHLLFATTADPRVVLQLLDKILDDLAVRGNARFIVYKEFDESSAQQMLSLLELGYRRAQTGHVSLLSGNSVPQTGQARLSFVFTALIGLPKQSDAWFEPGQHPPPSFGPISKPSANFYTVIRCLGILEFA